VIKKYITDIVGILIIISCVIIFAGKPHIDYNPPPAATVQIDKKKVSEIKNETEAVRENKALYAALEKRNIFTEAGGYAATEVSLSALPPNPYTLIAILQGKDKKAVFREYTGAIVTVPVGKKMIDGYIVQSIEGLTVKLKRDKEEKKFRVFSPESASASLSPEDMKKLAANPYKLIGILQGKEKKAVIRDYNNSAVIIGVGEKLNDGSVVTGISDVSVNLKKGNEKIEWKIFGNHAP
jgi:hypothetical protein